jgi:hypothetical protein
MPASRVQEQQETGSLDLHRSALWDQLAGGFHSGFWVLGFATRPGPITNTALTRPIREAEHPPTNVTKPRQDKEVKNKFAFKYGIKVVEK